MAVSTLSLVSRIAVERARARVPGLAPDSVEVVQLTRGRPYVVVRMLPQGLLVLDERGRLVRGRERLVTIGRHLLAVARVQACLQEARLERRREHVAESVLLLDGQRRHFAQVPVRRRIGGVIDALEQLGTSLEALCSLLESQRVRPPTERTLKRTIALLNVAAGADRRVVRATRELASEVLRLDGVPPHATALRRWLVARLASTDLAFFYWELDEVQASQDVDAFLASARACGV